MIGSLVKYSAEKSKLYFPVTVHCDMFDGLIGLVVSYAKKDTGDEQVKVQWMKPVPYPNQKNALWQRPNETVTELNLLCFEVISAVW
jgi:hypothetical protein